MDREKVFADVLDKKEPFKDYKNNCARKSAKVEFFEKMLVHRFDQKFEISPTLIFWKNRLRKSIWEHSS